MSRFAPLFGGRGFQGLLIALTLLLSSCVDAPSVPSGSGVGVWVIAPVLSLVGPGGERPMTAAQQDALGLAFDRVDRFRMVVRRAADNVVVLDTVLVVTPGQAEYDLSVPVAAKTDEQFLVTLTALQGATVLFTAENIPAKAAPAGVPGAAPPPPVQIPLVYTGPGATATAVTVGPAQVVLAPGGTATVGASVRDAGGAVVAGVPLAWTTSATGVATVTSAGVVTAAGEGLATITATSPTGLAASATIYVVSGELAYVEGGVLKVRGVAAGTSVNRATGGASQPAWSADGARLYYVAGGQVWRAEGPALASGSWPSVSPDATKLAVERGGQVWFVNDDGSEATQGPAGATPVWADASTLLVGGGGVQRVRADGTGRTTVVDGAAALPALASDGRIAWVVAGELRATGVTRALLTGATGRPTWSSNGRWLVVGTASGLMLVPADGGAAAVALPGLGSATDPAFRRTGTLAPVASVRVTGFSPEPPVPGAAVQVLGSGFDWIIRANNRVTWPTRDGAVQSAVGVVTEGAISTVMPRNVIAGQVRVETRSGTGVLAFVPTLGSLEVTARTPWGAARAGVGVALAGPSGPVSGTTDANGSLVLAGLIPGTYTATITPPAGWVVVGERVRTLSLGAEVVGLALELTPVIASVALSPAAPALAVGGSLGVSLVITGADGQSVPQAQGLVWRSGSAELTVTPGSGLSATLGAVFAGEAAGSSVLEASFGGRSYTFPVTVTSSISGAVTRETGATPAPPAPDVTVQVRRGGAVLAEARTGADGRYTAAGLFRGTYDVVPQPQAELLPVPAGQTVILDAANPTGRADFRMQSFAGLDVTARTPWDTPVSGVLAVLLRADGTEAARGTTDAEGRLALVRLAAGTYTLRITVPTGFGLTGDATRSLTLSPGTQSLALQVVPVIQSVVTIPADLSVEVGSVLDVQLVAKDINGNVIPVQSGTWMAITGHIAAGGVGLRGQIGGRYPSASGGAQLGVELNGRIHTFPVSVTSYIQGTVTQDAAPTGSPSAEGEGPQAATAPAVGVTVTIRIAEGPTVGTAVTSGAGTYRLGGLFQGTYEVLPAAQGGLTPIPISRVVILDGTHPTGRADFNMSRGTVYSLNVTATPDSIRALGATGQVTVQAFDSLGNLLGGRTTTYVSTNPSIATVNATGQVTALTNGAAWIRATVDSKTDSVRVVVDQRAASLILKDPKTGLPADSVQGFTLDTGTVRYEAKDARGNVVPEAHRRPTFTTSNAAVVTVNATTGYVSLVSVGTADVTAGMDGVTDVLKFKVLGTHAGDLWINSESDIAAVQAGLIGRVNGSLYIVETNLANVAGLTSILEVVGGVYVEDNPNLANLNGLTNLRHVGGSVALYANPLLSSTSIFPHLVDIPGDLTVNSGARVFGMPALRTIGAQLRAWGGETTTLLEFRLPALVSAGSVSIYGNYALTTLHMPLLQETTGAYGGGWAPPLQTSSKALTSGLPHRSQALVDPAAARRERAEAAEASRSQRRSELESRKADAERARSRVRSEAPVVHGMQLDLPGSGDDVVRYEYLTRRASERSEARLVRPKNPKPLRPTRPQRNGYSVYGGFFVKGHPELTGLSFPALAHVNGELDISENDRATSVAFPVLGSVGGGFYVYDMASMTSLTAPRLGSVGDDLDVRDNDALSVIQIATGSTLEVGSDLTIESNPALTSVQIPGLTYVYDEVGYYDNTINGSVAIGSAGPLEVGWNLVLHGNEGGFTFSAPGLVWVYDEIVVYDNPGLTSFTAATTGGPAEVNYGIYFWDNPTVTTVAMPQVVTVDDWVEFGGNAELRSFDMAGLTSVHGLLLSSNGNPSHPLTFSFPALASVSSHLWVSVPDSPGGEGLQGTSEYGDGTAAVLLPSLVSVGGDVSIEGNGILSTLNLASLQWVGGALRVSENTSLGSFSLPALKWTGDLVLVSFNPMLTTFSAPALQSTAGPPGSPAGAPSGPIGVPSPEGGGWVVVFGNGALGGFNLTSLSKTGGVRVSNNGVLVSLPALPSLAPGASVVVEHSAALTNLGGLSGVTRLYEVRIAFNPSLTNVTGLGSLQEAYAVRLRGNSTLTSVTLPSLTQVWRYFQIDYHPALTGITAPSLGILGAGSGPSPSMGNLDLSYNGLLTTASFPVLASVDGAIRIAYSGLTTLNGFSAIRSPVYGVLIERNVNLTNVMGLSGIGTTFANPAVAGQFRIIDNASLCSGDAHNLIVAIGSRNPGYAFAVPPVNAGNTGTCGNQEEN